MKKQLTALAAGVVFAAAAQSSFAGSIVIGPLSPTITLGPSCEATLTSAPDFGTYPTTNVDLINKAAGGISIKCSSGLEYAVLVGGGGNYDWGASRRYMIGTNPVNKMQYRLRKGLTDIGDAVDPAYASYDGTYVETTDLAAITATGNGNLQLYNFTANILISSSRVVDDYNDTVAVLVQY